VTEREIFLEALEISTPEARAAHLKGACAGDVALRWKVDELLKEHFANDSLLAGPAVEKAVEVQTVPEPVGEKPGERIGRYKIREKIGEGGCGVVYVAEQEEPIRRRVALKVVKLGMDTQQVVARFNAERQALALMDHPNIAKILDAGATGAGRPYFVMELVRGIRITDYCDQQKLDTNQRLDLFILVCQAVQHAHQKGVIHRDLKPSNILVTLHDGVPVPKVIDFGIAKATQGRLTDQTVYTAFEQFIGTPAYMSPEQAEMSGLDIDTRTDIYSLGVLLFELLTGKTPFDAHDLIAASLDQMRRTIREKQPPKPSTCLSSMLGAELAMVAQHHAAEAPKLINLVRGDLDWIVMRCLEKDRTRRYETASGLAMDIDRYLKNEPVIARPPSRLYAFRKTVQRHKLAFGATGAVTLAVLAGVIASTLQAVRATRAEREQSLQRELAQRAEAEQVRLRQQADAARATEAAARQQAEEARVQAQTNEQRAQTEAVRSAQVAHFLQDMLKGVGPSVALGRDTKLLREILDQTAARLGDLKNQPAVEADLRTTLGNVYSDLGEYAIAADMHQEALALRRGLHGDEHPDVATSLSNLANVLHQQGKFPEAEVLYRRALALRTKLLGEEHGDVISCLGGLAKVLWRQGKMDEAEGLQRQTLQMQRKLLGNQNEQVAETLDSLAAMLWTKRLLDEAEALAREALTMRRKLFGKEHPSVAMSLNNLGNVVRDQRKLVEAEDIHREALAMRRKLLGQEHPLVAISLFNLADVLCDEGKLAEAEPLVRECLSIRERRIPDQWRVFSTRSLLGGILLARRQYAEAEPLLVSGYEGMRQREEKISADGKMHPREALERLVQLYEATGQPEKAAEYKQKLGRVEDKTQNKR